MPQLDCMSVNTKCEATGALQMEQSCFIENGKNGILMLPIYIPHTVAIQIIGTEQDHAAGWQSWFQELLLFNTKNANSWRLEADDVGFN